MSCAGDGAWTRPHLHASGRPCGGCSGGCGAGCRGGRRALGAGLRHLVSRLAWCCRSRRRAGCMILLHERCPMPLLCRLLALPDPAPDACWSGTGRLPLTSLTHPHTHAHTQRTHPQRAPVRHAHAHTQLKPQHAPATGCAAAEALAASAMATASGVTCRRRHREHTHTHTHAHTHTHTHTHTHKTPAMRKVESATCAARRVLPDACCPTRLARRVLPNVCATRVLPNVCATRVLPNVFATRLPLHLQPHAALQRGRQVPVGLEEEREGGGGGGEGGRWGDRGLGTCWGACRR
jgi:hypothetical protein